MTRERSQTVKVTVNWERCASTGSCVQICPDVFALDASGQLQVVETPDESLHAEVWDAADMCPTAAITVHD